MSRQPRLIGSGSSYFATKRHITAQAVLTTVDVSLFTHSPVTQAYGTSQPAIMHRERQRRYHVVLTPAAIAHLLIDDETACTTHSLTAGIRLPVQGERFERKHRSVGEADAPASKPAAIWTLRLVDVANSSLYRCSTHFVSALH